MRYLVFQLSCLGLPLQFLNINLFALLDIRLTSFYEYEFDVIQYPELDICIRFVSDWVRLLTSIPKYRKSSIGFISFGCFDWSESLS